MNKKLSSLKIHNIIFCTIILILFVIFGVINTNADEINNNKNDEVLPSNNIQLGYNYRKLIKEETSKRNSTYSIIDTKKEEIIFFSKIFGYDFNNIYNDLKIINNQNENANNIGQIKDKRDNMLTYPSFEYGLIEYFYNLNSTKRIKRTNIYTPYEGNSEYIENLILYFSSIYNNVDSKLLLSIGAAESGYYKVKFMLRYNNIYGGMSNNGLIKYNNIEIGTLTFVRMMSKNYFAKGYTNMYSIGKIYCPVIENGTKKASNHWLNLVNKALNKYNNYNTNIEINKIIEQI